jgi:metal-sulfur cluster biosynthetic enzyme
MKKYEITLNGCDDNTMIFMHLTKQECNLIEKIADAVNDASTCQRMPRLYIEECEEKE